MKRTLARAIGPHLANTPIPETFVASLVLGGLLHALARRPITRQGQTLRLQGIGVLALGLLLNAWAMFAVRQIRIDQPERLITSGPYAHSRNPMYLGWGLCSLGVAALANSCWLLAGTLAAGLYHHLIEIPKEEAALQARFGEIYHAYRRKVPRYL